MVECQLTNVEKIIDLENHHLVTIIVIINLIKKHQGMLELVEESWLKNGIYTQSQNICTQNIYELQRKNKNFRVGKTWQTPCHSSNESQRHH